MLQETLSPRKLICCSMALGLAIMFVFTMGLLSLYFAVGIFGGDFCEQYAPYAVYVSVPHLSGEFLFSRQEQLTNRVRCVAGSPAAIHGSVDMHTRRKFFRVTRRIRLLQRQHHFSSQSESFLAPKRSSESVSSTASTFARPSAVGGYRRQWNPRVCIAVQLDKYVWCSF